MYIFKNTVYLHGIKHVYVIIIIYDDFFFLKIYKHNILLWLCVNTKLQETQSSIYFSFFLFFTHQLMFMLYIVHNTKYILTTDTWSLHTYICIYTILYTYI